MQGDRSLLKEVGARLRRIEATFPNRAKAAAAAGVAKSTFQSWVNGERDPSFLALVRLCAVTGFSLDWLATGRGPMHREQKTDPAQASYWREKLTTALLEYRAAVARAGVPAPPAEMAMLIRDQLAFGELRPDDLVATLRLFTRPPWGDGGAEEALDKPHESDSAPGQPRPDSGPDGRRPPGQPLPDQE